VASPTSRPLPVPWRLAVYWSVPLAFIVAGTVGYRVVERWHWFDAFYVAVITLTSMGHATEYAFSRGGRLLTVSLALGGIWTIAVAATQLLGMILTGELRGFAQRRRMEKRIAALEQHVIVCGFGRVGHRLCADLTEAGVPVAVIDRRDGALEAARQVGAHLVLGDATTDAALTTAGIDRARAVVAVTGSDADNLLITMTARQLRPQMTILSSAHDEGTMPKLLRAGATGGASPAAIAGHHLAAALLHPAALAAAVELQEQVVRPGSAFDGKTVRTSGLRSRNGHILVAIKRADGSLSFDPEDDAPIGAGDTLLTLCRHEPQKSR
jgi:voltage-gated potassium channel